jgi:putative endonuclease
MNKFYMYIVYSLKLDKFYIGSTNNLERRLQDHNRGKTAFAKQGMPWELKYYEEFKSKTEAYNRELEVKKRKDRNYIKKLISQ